MDIIFLGLLFADRIIGINDLPIKATDWLYATSSFLNPGGV